MFEIYLLVLGHPTPSDQFLHETKLLFNLFIDQKDLLDSAIDFVRKNIGKLVKTSGWTKMVNINPALIAKISSDIIFSK